MGLAWLLISEVTTLSVRVTFRRFSRKKEIYSTALSSSARVFSNIRWNRQWNPQFCTRPSIRLGSCFEFFSFHAKAITPCDAHSLFVASNLCLWVWGLLLWKSAPLVLRRAELEQGRLPKALSLLKVFARSELATGTGLAGCKDLGHLFISWHYVCLFYQQFLQSPWKPHSHTCLSLGENLQAAECKTWILLDLRLDRVTRWI